jgi:hypothetical protein
MDEPAALPCADKLTFGTKDEASASAVVVQYQHGTKVRPYQCKYCSLWHLTSDYNE